MAKTVLITGTAGFIGFHLAKKVIDLGYQVIGLDVINDYYSIDLKYARLAEHGINREEIQPKKLVQSVKYPNYSFVQADLADKDFILDFMMSQKFDCVVNLAAQAGVRYSIENPWAYTHSNVDGFMSILEGSRHSNVGNVIYASTSSVYGLNTAMPLRESTFTEHPMALYAATKKANEMMAHSYSHLFNLPTTGLRFFTVYGPWGRPDMALFLFTKAILAGEPIKIFNNGHMVRDFTFVADIVEAISRLIEKPATPDPTWDSNNPDPSSSSAPYRIFNIGNSSPVELLSYVDALEKELGMEAIKDYLPMQPGDVPATNSDCKKLFDFIGYSASTKIETGIGQFVDWYRTYFNV